MPKQYCLHRVFHFTLLILTILILAACGSKSMKLVEKADEERMRQNFDESAKLYEQAIAADPQNAVAYNNYGVLLQMQKKWVEAEEKFNQAFSLFVKIRQKATVLNNIGLNYDLQGQYDVAEKHYLNSIQTDPDYYEAYHNLGSIYYVWEEYDKAIEYFFRALTLMEQSNVPNKSSALENCAQFLSLALYRKGDFEKAEKMLTGLVQMCPFNPKSYSILADVYASQDQFDKAIEMYSKALSLEPKSLNALVGKAESLAKQNKFDLAHEELEKAFQLNETSPYAYIAASKIYLREENREKAGEMLEIAQQREPDSKEIAELLQQLNAPEEKAE